MKYECEECQCKGYKCEPHISGGRHVTEKHIFGQDRHFINSRSISECRIKNNTSILQIFLNYGNNTR